MQNSPPLFQSPSKILSQSPFEFSNLVELLRYRARYQPDRRVYTFLVDGETEEIGITYGQLDRQARAIAAWLQSIDVEGQPVLLFYPPGLDYIAAFLGCLYAGCLATPAYPPRLNRPDSRLEALVANAQAGVALTTGPILANMERRLNHAPALTTLRWFATDTLAPIIAGKWQDPRVSGDTLAFLQYTSGSTATPKGVMVTHANLMHNLECIRQALQLTAESVSVSWLPGFHDMGLIDGIIQPLYTGFPGILMSPLAFLQRPVRWLEAISRYRATHSGGPNFAYELCARQITAKQCEQLDLSSWRSAYNGAEPVRKETLEQFAAAFQSCGFRANSFYPGYGLAEATLMVSGGLVKNGPVYCTVQADALEQNQIVEMPEMAEGSKVLVGCGQPWLGANIVIAHPESLTRCASNEAGEIWVAGPSVARGYWRNPTETQTTFQAYLADTGEGPFLRTGDLGFLRDGELFITGRLKDLIIIRGRNYYPQDIELTVEQCHPALLPGRGAAFSVEVNGEEQLVTVQEVQRQYRQLNVPEVAQAIRKAVADMYELPVYAVALIKPGAIPKTSSGKIQRHLCRTQFLTDSLEIVGNSILEEAAFETRLDTPNDVTPRTPTEEILVELWADVLGLNQVGIYDNFFELGGHSLLATQTIARVREMFEAELSLQTLFEGPTVADLAKNIEAAQGVARIEQMAPILPISRPKELPLSFSQERMWFLDQLQPNSAAYHLALAVRLKGPLDVKILEQSFNQVAQRHEALRTVFTNVNGRPAQVVNPHLALVLPVVDVQKISCVEPESKVRRLAAIEAQRPFDLAQGPLLRVTLFQLGVEDHVLLVVAHHIVADAWSFSVLWQEIASLYKSFVAGEAASLLPLPIQYADFAHWQRQWLRGKNLETQLNYWKQQLAGSPLVLELPTDRPRPAIQTFKGASQTLPLAKTLVEALRDLSRRQGTTLFMTLLAAFQVLLYRYTGQEDILVGAPIANRQWLAVEKLIGVFVNTLVIRTDISGNPPFKELLARVRQAALGAYAHQDLPFEQLVEELKPKRDLSHGPLIQVLFSLANPPLPVIQLPKLTWEIFEFDRGAAQFDLTLALVDTKQVQMMSVEYNTDLFDHATISRMLGHFQILLESIVSNGLQQRLADLPILSPTEQHQLLVTWNNTRSTYPQNVCVHHLFEAQVEKTPHSVAVIFEDQQLTYQQLNERANQLARHLQTLGVGPEVSVGIYIGRSLEMMVALLGILKAGGCYVPLDPNYPQQRLAYILHNSGARVLLTQQDLLNNLPNHAARVVCLDKDWAMIATASPENPVNDVSPENLAYIIYTSGSTGTPKGVEIPHRTVVNFLNAMRRQPGLTNQDTLLAVTTLSFDIAVLELFLPLTVGARVVVAGHLLAADGAGLVKALAKFGVTVMQATPATWQFMLEAGWKDAAHLKVFCGGEVLPRELAAQLLAIGAYLWNMYGPTETTIWSALYKVEATNAPIPIGRPIDNTQLYILDKYLQPAPIGVPGQLYIGGDGLARGYHGRPELTAEKFIPNPFSRQPGQRLYQTGDLVRYLPNGNIEFLGRIDHQIKLRGFRIELGEIESVLRQHQAVREAITVIDEENIDDKRLVAYVTPNPGETLVINELRHHARQKLPDYMIPSAFVTLDALPLTPNGKVNRRALPPPLQTLPQADETFSGPRDTLEQQLTDLWQEILKVHPISIKDNFFELGGHSLLAVRLFAQIEEKLGRSLPVVTLFQAPTIEQLARQIRVSAETASIASSLVAVQPNGSKPPFFCAHGMGGGVLDYANLAHHLGPDQPFYALQERALAEPGEPFASIEAMARHYVKAIQSVQPDGPYYLGGYCYGGTIAFEMAWRLQRQGFQVNLLAIIDNRPPGKYHRPLWSPAFWAAFLKNLPYWLDDFWQLGPKRMIARLKRKVTLLIEDRQRAAHHAGDTPSLADLEAVLDIDLSGIPEKHYRILIAHYKAMLNYTPQPYQGQVTLFKTQRRSLFGPFDPFMGWNSLAAGGVEIREVVGFHGNLLLEPDVQNLAKELSASLDKAQR